MAVFFTAVVRTPITGILLVVEMTANTSQLIPMMFACGAAVIATTAIHSEPIYDTLRHRMLAGDKSRGTHTAESTGTSGA
jgi:CIC family chloride channel protein